MVGGMGTRIQVFLERYFTHTGRLYIRFSYIIMFIGPRVFLIFELHTSRVFLASIRIPRHIARKGIPVNKPAATRVHVITCSCTSSTCLSRPY